ncbi:hypothetical protein VNI00_018637 [Paramarasmius palmivorus]|uniref:F-box domain-containing protein n=1 Tax=Paramarasmius palmivorus TaxID=297713 RepID=A0AAW0AXP6_9AGAR
MCNALTVPRLRPLFSPEIVHYICTYLSRAELFALTLVSRFFRDVAHWHLMDSLTVEPRTNEVSQRYVTSLIEGSSKPVVRHVMLDIAIAMYQILYAVSKACSPESTRSLAVASSIRYADWNYLSTIFTKHLAFHLPRVDTLLLKPLDSRFQFALMSAFSSTLVKLTIYSAICATRDGWSQITLPCLEDIALVQDAPVPASEDSIILLVVKFIEIPKLKHASLIAVTDGRVFSVYEFLLAFASTLESVKILGLFHYESHSQRLLPKLQRVTSFNIEADLAHGMFLLTDDGPDFLPGLKRFTIEGDWKSLDDGSYNLQWKSMKRTFTHIAGISPKPVVVCGYRGATVRNRGIFSRNMVGQLRDASGWDIRDTFMVEERRCEDMPSRRSGFIDTTPRLRHVLPVKPQNLLSDDGDSDGSDSVI